MSSGAARILEILRAAAEDSSSDNACSGEALSHELAVSRNQIWKHVERLRARGYSIEGARGGGYRLVASPDRLYPEEIQAGLGTHWLAHDVVHYDETDSTNRVAFELGTGGAAHGTVVIAESQSAGRGRLGRQFFSPPNLNLYTSIVLRPPIDIAAAPTLIQASGLAVAEAVAETLGPTREHEIEIKWPNDVLLGGLKTSGILMEMSSEATRVGFIVLGIGVNLNVERERFPDDFRHLATSLRSHCGKAVDRAAFTRRLYCILEGLVDEHTAGGFAALRSRFDRYFRMPGRRIRVIETRGGSEQSFDGTALGIADDGSLSVRKDVEGGGEGPVVQIIAGDVTLAKQAPPLPPTNEQERPPA